MCPECFKDMLIKACVKMPGDQLHLWAALQLSHFPESCCSNMVIAKISFPRRWNGWPWQIVGCGAELVTWKQHGSTLVEINKHRYVWAPLVRFLWEDASSFVAKGLCHSGLRMILQNHVKVRHPNFSLTFPTPPSWVLERFLLLWQETLPGWLLRRHSLDLIRPSIWCHVKPWQAHLCSAARLPVHTRTNLIWPEGSSCD